MIIFNSENSRKSPNADQFGFKHVIQCSSNLFYLFCGSGAFVRLPPCQWRREGGRRVACAPGGIMQGAAFRGAKIWNSEIWPTLANWRLHCRQWYFTPPNTPQFRDHTHNCQCSTTPHKAVCTQINLHCWSDWSFTCCKTVEDPLPSYCSTGNRNSVFCTIHVLPRWEMGKWEGMREEREWKGREQEGTPSVGSDPHVRNPEKNPDCRTDLICGGGNRRLPGAANNLASPLD